jgi:ribosomal protein L32
MARTALVCTTCGHVGIPKTHTPGHFLIELALWLLLLVPGLLYSLWRLHARRQVCESCGGSTLVPTTSPVGQQITGRRI